MSRNSPLADRGDTASPCISVCEIAPATGLCSGCFRTLDEIAAWSILDASAKRAVLQALSERLAASQRDPQASPSNCDAPPSSPPERG